MTAAWKSALKALGELRPDEPMARHTTLGVGGAARWYFRPANRLALADALQVLPTDIRLLPIGRGSNMLIADSGFDGMVIDLGRLNHIAEEDQRIRAEAGVRMSRLANRCEKLGLTGLEFMATVPGDIGGGIAMNAGAFGQQVSDTLRSIDIVHRDGRCEQINAEDITMRYRQTELPAGSLVFSACFGLQSDAPQAIRKRMAVIRNRRSTSQPLTQPNCGSVFKNPPGDHAARLIEQAGLKGQRAGQACISDMHANFIINEGGATSRNVLDLIRRIQEAVLQQTGVQLEPEVKILGDAA